MAHCVLLPAYYLVKTSLRICLSSLGTCCARLCSAARLVSPAADRGADLDADLASAEAEAEAEATMAAAAAAAAAAEVAAAEVAAAEVAAAEATTAVVVPRVCCDRRHLG